jgi:biotin carboxyl carrier protein
MAQPGREAVKISAQVGDEVLDVTVERRDGLYVVEVDGSSHDVDVRKLEADFYSIITGGRSYEVSVESTRGGYVVRHGAAELLVRLSDPSRPAREALGAADGPERVLSVMPGKVVRVLVQEGDAVQEGQGLVVVEAMKMENEITARKAGRVSSVAVAPGQAVESGAELLVIE